MLGKMQNKVNEYIEYILNKETITKEDYEVLAGEIYRLKQEEHNKERCKAMLEAVSNIK